jgi:hypothetical protein
MPQRGFGVVQLADQMDTSLIERLPVQRRSDLPRRPLEEPCAQPLFQILDCNGGRCLGDFQHVNAQILRANGGFA